MNHILKVSQYIVLIVLVGLLSQPAGMVYGAPTDPPQPKLSEKIVCPISGNPVSEDATAKHHDGQVFFCCEKCLAAFKKTPEKYATKANFQLVATEQYRQKGCPMSGRPTKPATEIAAAIGEAEVEVGFCCKNCRGAAAGKEGDARLEMLFGKKAFAKAFEVAKRESQE